MNETKNMMVAYRLDVLMAEWNRKNVEYTNKNFLHLKPEVLSVTEGKRYYKLVVAVAGTEGRRVYGFVDKGTGDIFMAAGWASPAKGVRGSVMDEDYGMSCCGPYGINYKKLGNIGW